jgi:hypothetical protein
MDLPPRASLPTSPTESTQEDDLRAVEEEGLQPSPLPVTLPGATSARDISSHHPVHLTPSAESSSSLPRVQIQECLAHDHRLQASPHPLPAAASLEPTRPSPSPPPPPADALFSTMSQYQPVSAASGANPRAMSQVSPGFIFVNFPKSIRLLLVFGASILPWLPAQWQIHLSCLLSHVSSVLRLIAGTRGASWGDG